MVVLCADFHHKLLRQMSVMPKLRGVEHLSLMAHLLNRAVLHRLKLHVQVLRQRLLSLELLVVSILLQRPEKFEESIASSFVMAMQLDLYLRDSAHMKAF
jgi:hypothetical protein